MTFKVKLEIFEGPLDLLLHLVKQNHLEIGLISIAQITDQYLKTIELMQSLDLEVAGEFLVVAATLMEIKSRALLPQPVVAQEETEEPDPAMELIRRLKEYQKFKEAAEQLAAMEKERQVTYFRSERSDASFEAVEECVEASLFDLLTAFSQFMSGRISSKMVHELLQDEATVEEKIAFLRQWVHERKKVNFLELLSQTKSRLEAVAIFLALLELIRLHEVVIRQPHLFGEIWIFPNVGGGVPQPDGLPQP